MVLQDKWTLDALLGVGGMAAVYAATHRNGKRVAVKVLHAELSHDEEVQQRFLQEGYAANTIEHEGAVSVLDDDVAPDGSAFIVMELLEGETLEARWERSGQAPRRCARCSRSPTSCSTCSRRRTRRASSTATSSRRTSSSREAGALKVLDFGIAQVFEAQQARATSTRAGIGDGDAGVHGAGAGARAVGRGRRAHRPLGGRARRCSRC